MQSISNNKIAKNTVLLYIRMMIVMLINLYTVRIVLRELGVEDYGIYNVVAGVITMMSSLSSVMASATQRFYSFALGKGDRGKLRAIFSVSINIFSIISLVSLLLGESVGLWFLNTQLVIPNERLIAANWIYQFSMLAFIANMLHYPYYAASIAHENMGLFAIVSTVDAVLKLITALAIPYVFMDHLVYYGLTLLVFHVLIFATYVFFCKKKYVECHYQFTKDRSLHRDMLTFSGWTLFSSLASVGMNQVITLLINIFFGPVVNAARAISIQVNSALSTFCNSFIMAVRPPMIKAFAEDNYDYLNKVFLISNKFTYYCLLMVTVPLVLEMNVILRLWLGEFTPQTVLFCQLIVIYGMILSLCNPITIIVQATGKMKYYTMYVETLTLLTPVVVYLLFKFGLAAESAFYAMIVMIILAHLVRLYCLKKIYTGFSYKVYLVKFILPAFLVTIIVALLCYYIDMQIDNVFIRFICIVTLSVISTMLLSYLIGLDKSERAMIRSYIKLF